MFSQPLVGEFVMRAAREGLLLVILLSAPPLIASLVVGLIISVLQTATQIHDQGLMLVPKLLVVGVVLVVMGPALGAQLLRFSHALLLAIPIVR